MTQPHHRVVIRERASADLPAAAAALVEVHRTDGYPVEGVADPTAWLTTTDQIGAWVAELDDRIVGHVAIGEPQAGDAAARQWADRNETGSHRIAVLGRLFVLPTARGHMIGRHLIEAASAYSREHEIRLVLDVMFKDAAAIRLYEQLGWRRIGTTAHDTGRGSTIPAYCYVSPA